MKVRMLKDWSFHKSGDVADVFEPTGRNWISSGIAEEVGEPRAIKAERAISEDPVEVAMLSPAKQRPARKQ